MPIKTKLYNLRTQKKKVADPDSSSSDSSSESESEYRPTTSTSEDEETVYTECSEEEAEEIEFDTKAFRKTVAKIFPSKYSKERAKKADKKKVQDECEEDAVDSSSSEDAPPPKKKKSSKKSKPVDDDDLFETEDEVEEESPKKKKHSKTKRSSKKHRHRDADSDDESGDDDREEGKFNLIFNVGGGGLDEEEEYEEEEELESLVEDIMEEFDSDDEKTFMGEAYQSVAEKKVPKKTKEVPKEDEKPKKTKVIEEPNLIPIPEDVEDEYKEMLDVKKMLSEQLKRRPNNKILKKSLKQCNEGIKKLARKARHNNTNAYYKLVNQERRQEDEIDYFKHRLSNKEQQGIMTDLKEINKTIYAEKPYRLTLLQSKIPAKFKTVAMQRLNTLKSMDRGDHEYYKIKNWVDAFMRIPFGIYRSINVNLSDGLDVCDSFMENARKTLDDCVYGLNDAKLQIMQMLGQWIVNPNSVGTSIAIHGPPGTGKTSIVKDGISKILGREFAFIALGGCGDGAFLEGHSYTYEGSMWGKIAQILMECKSMNPIIYFDELDKVSDSARGQEIIGILTHLTDTSQNSEFHDKYFSEVSLDLSKCLFIFSYNDEHLVNPILKDRMYRIQTKGYDTKEKITIARDYLLPKIREQVSFSATDITIPDETLQYIISTPHLTKGESGVRNLKRCLEIVHTKLNLYRLVKPGNAMFEKDLGVKVQFPITITRKDVDIFIKNNETLNPSILAMYV